ncbi:MAG: hypothetical protein ACOYKZ_03490 [Chlamydiia bacterium]
MTGPSKGIFPNGGAPIDPEKPGVTRSNVSGRNYSTDPEDRVRKSGVGFRARFEDEASEAQPLGSRQWKRSPPPSPIDMELVEEKKAEDMNRQGERDQLAKHEPAQSYAKFREALQQNIQDKHAQRQPPREGASQSSVASSSRAPTHDQDRSAQRMREVNYNTFPAPRAEQKSSLMVAVHKAGAALQALGRGIARLLQGPR